MKRRGFLKVLLASPAVPYVPEVKPSLVSLCAGYGMPGEIVQSVDFYPSNCGLVSRDVWERGDVVWDGELWWVNK